MHQNRASIAYMGAACRAHKAHDSSSGSGSGSDNGDSSGSEHSEQDDEELLGTCGTTVSSKARGGKGEGEGAFGKRRHGGTEAAAAQAPKRHSGPAQGSGRGGAGPGAGGRRAARRLHRDTQLRMLFRYSPDTLDEVLEAVAHGEVGEGGGTPHAAASCPGCDYVCYKLREQEDPKPAILTSCVQSWNFARVPARECGRLAPLHVDKP